MGLIQEFKEFLQEYKILGLAIAFIIGAAINSLVASLVNDIIMPVITAFIPQGAWKEATLILGPVVLKWGSFLANMINFVIIAFVIFIIAKIFFKEKKVTKK
ncbi:MAG: large conductance mechanosensitive channel protein MscL [Candidatus Nanoarchaeia archaeon]|nr:large conductance mechanosensitive channel protein MscL [Candidatus Nanoarchaeia archaeon]